MSDRKSLRPAISAAEFKLWVTKRSGVEGMAGDTLPEYGVLEYRRYDGMGMGMRGGSFEIWGGEKARKLEVCDVQGVDV
ncbi:hypothetical protein CVT26_001350 [Gymnopilus dilepis]|uniref:Uncharacterized protein n=1 Tax=Gymnopilus dilepis TaxID=231916 RepID=A0A409YM67_9AGAR|nr:hypothetical protein CVT26_001350 [Gymnopilus dilepis]